MGERCGCARRVAASLQLLRLSCSMFPIQGEPERQGLVIGLVPEVGRRVSSISFILLRRGGSTIVLTARQEFHASDRCGVAPEGSSPATAAPAAKFSSKGSRPAETRSMTWCQGFFRSSRSLNPKPSHMRLASTSCKSSGDVT